METEQQEKAQSESVFESQGVDPRELAVLHWDGLAAAFHSIAKQNGKSYGELVKHGVVFVASEIANTGDLSILNELPDSLARLIGQILIAGATELDARHAQDTSDAALLARLNAIKSKSNVQD